MTMVQIALATSCGLLFGELLGHITRTGPNWRRAFDGIVGVWIVTLGWYIMGTGVAV